MKNKQLIFRYILLVGLVLLLSLMTGCYWGDFFIDIEQRTTGTIGFNLYVPYMLKYFQTKDGPILPFPADENEFRTLLSDLPGVTVLNLSFADTTSGWNVNGEVRYSSINSFTQVAGFFSGIEISADQWASESIITITIPQKNMVLEESPVETYYRNLLSQNSVKLSFSGGLDMARVQNGVRQPDGTVLFEFSPASILETEQTVVIGW